MQESLRVRGGLRSSGGDPGIERDLGVSLGPDSAHGGGAGDSESEGISFCSGPTVQKSGQDKKGMRCAWFLSWDVLGGRAWRDRGKSRVVRMWE